MFPLILTFNFDLIFNQYWLLGVQIGYLDRVNFLAAIAALCVAMSVCLSVGRSVGPSVGLSVPSSN